MMTNELSTNEFIHEFQKLVRINREYVLKKIEPNSNMSHKHLEKFT